MSARPRAEPWFRAPGERFALAAEQYDRTRSQVVYFRGGTMRIAVREIFDGVRWHVERLPEPARHCEQCASEAADVRERVGDQDDNGMLFVNGILRLRATLCSRCARMLRQ